MQKIDTIEIKNFKSIRHQKIEGCKRVNVFIGYPNVGKSNILEALSLFSISGESKDLSSYVRFERFTTLFFNGEISKQAEVRINTAHRFIANGGNESVSFQQQFQPDGTSFEKYDDGFMHIDDSAEVLSKKKFSISSQHNQGQIEGYTLASIGKENNLAEIRKYEFQKNITFTDRGHFELSTPFGNNIFNIISSNSSLRKEIVELLSQYDLKFVNDKETQTYRIMKFIDSDNIFTIPYSMLADTLQRLIFYKAAILSNKESVLLFEEPEAHMFPPYVKKFTTDVIFDETNQFFIATHSPYVLEEFIEEIEKDLAVYVVDYHKGETIIKRLTDEQVREVAQFGIDLFFNLESYLDKYGQPHSA